MKKSVNTQSISLGALQSGLEESAANLKAAQRAKLRADQDYERATEAYERARVALNAGVQTLKSAASVPNMYAN
jgi:hypothetical protein